MLPAAVSPPAHSRPIRHLEVVDTTYPLPPAPDAEFRVRELCFGALALSWGRYACPVPHTLVVEPAGPALVSHFRLHEALPRPQRAAPGLTEQEFVCYQEAVSSYELRLAPTLVAPRVFAEIRLGADYFPTLSPVESPWARRLLTATPGALPSLDGRAAITPAMLGILHELRCAPYQGYLQGLFLEAKAIELFLLQLAQLERPISQRLSPADVQGVQEARAYLDAHYDQPGTILELSRRVGLNQTKLKAGFQQLFATTVFGYVRQRRMQQARQLLEAGLSIAAVAERVGYQQPHHFTAAFKKQFGLLPSIFSRGR